MGAAIKTIPAQIFHDPREQVRAVLGQDYLTSVLQGGNLSKSIMILTDKRIYQRGKIFEFTTQGHLVSSAGERVVNIRDVTGTSFKEKNFPLILIGAVAFIILAMFSFIRAFNTLKHLNPGKSAVIYIGPSASVWKGMFMGEVLQSIFLLIIAGTCFLFYFLRRKRFFIVEYPGGAIATDARWYSQEEMREFMRALSFVKDQIIEGKARNRNL